jgi:hypothetical protein
MKQDLLPYRIVKPPAAVRRARLDNIALVPASLLKHQGKYQTIARNLPKGSILICATPQQPRITRILNLVASFFRGHGHFVKTLPYSMLV